MWQPTEKVGVNVTARADSSGRRVDSYQHTAILDSHQGKQREDGRGGKVPGASLVVVSVGIPGRRPCFPLDKKTIRQFLILYSSFLIKQLLADTSNGLLYGLAELLFKKHGDSQQEKTFGWIDENRPPARGQRAAVSRRVRRPGDRRSGGIHPAEPPAVMPLRSTLSGGRRRSWSTSSAARRRPTVPIRRPRTSQLPGVLTIKMHSGHTRSASSTRGSRRPPSRMA